MFTKSLARSKDRRLYEICVIFEILLRAISIMQRRGDDGLLTHCALRGFESHRRRSGCFLLKVKCTCSFSWKINLYYVK